MTDEFDALLDRFLNEYVAEDPVEATNLGIDGHDHELPDLSAAAFAHRAEWEDGWIARLSAARDGLTLDQEIDRGLVLAQLRGNAVMREWAPWRRNPATYVGPALEGVFALFLYRGMPDTELAAAAEARLHGAPALLEAGKANLDPALASPLFAERALDTCRAASTYCREIVPREVAEGPARDRLADAGEQAARAYEDFASYLAALRADARGAYAIGEELYSAMLREQEMLGYGAREMRDRGQAIFDEIARDMTGRARDLRGTDDWIKVVEELNADHPSSPEEMRATYTEWTERARTFVADRSLVTLPDGERCLVEPSPPFQRPIMAVASYNPPQPFKPSLTGHFFVPYPPDGEPPERIAKRMESNSFSTIPTVSVHEAYPGHHFHLVAVQANPRPLRRVFWSPYFGEGWALYVEQMMLEQGFYDDPRHEIGVGDSRIFRAARIVVDTSLHIGDMTFDEGVAFMRERTGLAEPTARAEVGRYCSWPTQAASYMTGAIEIERLKRRFLDEGRGDLRAFHDRLAGSGALPIALAERALFEDGAPGR